MKAREFSKAHKTPDRDAVPSAPETQGVAPLLQMQRTAGNQSTLRFLRSNGPGCGAPARIAWQVEHGMIETATVTAEGLVAHRNFQAGGPPLDVAVTGDVVWAVWSDGKGVWLTESKDATPTRLDERYCSEIAINAHAGNVWAGWVVDRQIRWARPGKGGQPMTMAAAGDGRLEIVAGEQPIAVLRYAEMEDDRAPRCKTELIVEEADLWTTKELLHSVSWWGKDIAATGQRSLHFLKIE